VLQRAVDSHAVLYFPQGFYRLSDTLRLREHTALIGLNPISTRLMVKDNEPAFGGFGTPKPLLESGKGGGNLINGIAIDTAARNPRICGCKWTAGPDSYMNDVKFYGGHGSMNPGGENVPVYNESRTADSDLPGNGTPSTGACGLRKMEAESLKISGAPVPMPPRAFSSPTPQRREPCMRFRWSTTCAARY